MKNFRIHTTEAEQPLILKMLSESNDIIVNNVEPTGIGITVQRDDADSFYETLLLNIQQHIRTPNVIITEPKYHQ